MAIIKNPVTVIQGGGSTPPEPLDPDEVYRDTRPSDWLEMPADEDVADNSIYYLLEVENDYPGNIGFYYQLELNVSSYHYNIDFGQVIDGVFTPDTTYSVSNVQSGTETTVQIPGSMFISTNDARQLIMRVTMVEPAAKIRGHMNGSGSELKSEFVHTVVELKVKATEANFRFGFGSMSNDYNAPFKTRYITVLGLSGSYFNYAFSGLPSLIAMRGDITFLAGSNCGYMFSGDESLVAIPAWDTSNVTSTAYMFSACYSLEIAPRLDCSSATTTAQMFNSCKSLRYVPDLDCSSATSTSSMFYNCESLEKAPNITTSNSLTNVSQMFLGCNALNEVSVFNTSHVTNFQRFFDTCKNLHTVPLFDTSSGTNFSYMFSECHSLLESPLFNTSSGTNFSYMFQNCTELKSVPLFNTSSGENFSYMFRGCENLKSAPNFNTSNGTTFNYMFYNCKTLRKLPQLDISSAMGVQNMFYGCKALTEADLSNWDFSSISAQNQMQAFLQYAMFNTGATIRLPVKAKMSSAGLGSYNTFAAYGGYGEVATTLVGHSEVRWVITETSEMLPLATNATNVFGANSAGGLRLNCVYVPDALYSTYAANAYWSTLGTRLKKLSDLPV